MNLKDLYNRWRHRELSPAAQIRKMIMQLFVLFMIVASLLYLVISGISGLTAFNPTSGKAALEKTREPEVGTWLAEVSREIEVGGGAARLDAVMSATYDLNKNRFQAFVRGTLPDSTAFTSDGKATLYLTNRDRDAGRAWRLVNDVCSKMAAVPAGTVAMPSGKELAAGGKSYWVDKSGTFRGRPAWVVGFTPSPEVIEQLLWVRFFDRVSPPRSPWALSASERDALQRQDYKVIRAMAFVLKSSREIIRIDTTVQMPGLGRFRMMATRGELPESDPFSQMNLGSPSC